MKEHIARTFEVFKRELKSYFESPVAYVFLVVFLILVGFFTWAGQLGNYFEIGQADLRPFFMWHPWLYLVLVPAVSMRLWAEERRSGTIELLLTLPVTLTETLIGKFLAAWAFLLIALGLTFPLPLSTSLQLHGDLDMGVVAAQYIGSALLAGTYLALGTLTSAMTRNQVISFVLAVCGCLFLVLAGYPPVTQFLSAWAPNFLVHAISSLSVMPHHDALQRGIIAARDIGFYFSAIVVLLVAAHMTLEGRKAS